LDIAILLYEGVTALDAVGPYEVLHLAPDVQVRFVAKQPGLIRTDFGMLHLNADDAIADVPEPDVVLVPGAPDPGGALGDETVLAWLRHAHETTLWTTSVCTGALVLGAAGLLAGLRATTHWMAMDALAPFGAQPTTQRVVRDGKVMTAAGVSSGIDMALSLVAAQWDQATAEEIQLIIEYDPEPPFQAGSPDKAPAAIRDRVIAKYAAALKA
jgi:transcriptional regulator GlxA family with amidase domain